MVTLEKLLAKNPYYLNDWSSKLDVMADFIGIRISVNDSEKTQKENNEIMERYKDTFDNVNILLASYTYANYSGSAFVLFEKDGNLYEVNGSHCSCYGLEDQWEPDETTIEALVMRVTKGNLGHEEYGDNEFAVELKELLEVDE